MQDEHRPGYFRDELGQWQKDRRKGGDRRGKTAAGRHDDERRRSGRRRTDRDIDRDHNAMIEEALQEFADGDTGD